MASRQDRALVVVAHPDDETIFLGGLLRALAMSATTVEVVCAVTDFGSPLMSHVRLAEFRRACKCLGVYPVPLDGVSDRKGTLEPGDLDSAIRRTCSGRTYDQVYTHGVWGEYGHRHHTEVCRSVHRIFDSVLSLAGPLSASLTITLTAEELSAKRRVAAEVYQSQPFASGWCTREERFIRLAQEEVELMTAISDHAAEPRQDFLTTERLINGDLEVHLRRSMAGFAATALPFPEIANIPSPIWSGVHGERHRVLADVLGMPPARATTEQGPQVRT